MKGKFKLSVLVMVLAFLSLSLMYGSYLIMNKDEGGDTTRVESTELDETADIPELIPEEKAPEIKRVTFCMAGDNLIHDNIYKQAWNRTGGEGYDFTLPYEGIESLISCQDIAFINQESPIAEDVAPLSGYPRFCSPKAVGEKIKDLGFNLVGIANNHMFDKDEEGLRAHMAFWEDLGVMTIGAWKSPEDMNEPLLLEKNGITFGFLPMTEHTNGLNAPKGSQIRYIRTDEWDLIEPQIDMINEQADFQVASIHWGIENSLDTASYQRELARKLADKGIDLIIGHHPHTLQPVEWIVREDGSRCLVIYSLGNFISSMLDQQNMLGGIMHLSISKDTSTGETGIETARMYPIVTHYDGPGRQDVRIIPLADYTDELAAKHGIRTYYPGFDLDYLNGIVEKNIPFEFLQDVPLNP